MFQYSTRVELSHGVVPAPNRPLDSICWDVAANRFQSGTDRRSSVYRLKNPAVVAHEHHLISTSIELRVKGNHVMICMSISGILSGGEPPITCNAPISTSIIGAEEIGPPSPYDLRILRVDRNDIVVPSLIQIDILFFTE